MPQHVPLVFESLREIAKKNCPEQVSLLLDDIKKHHNFPNSINNGSANNFYSGNSSNNNNSNYGNSTNHTSNNSNNQYNYHNSDNHQYQSHNQLLPQSQQIAGSSNNSNRDR